MTIYSSSDFGFASPAICPRCKCRENCTCEDTPSLDDHPMAVFHAGETFVSDSERAWLAWVKKVEALLGHDLDGNDLNEAGDGYSLDEAYSVWEAGETAEAYAAEIRARPRYVADIPLPEGWTWERVEAARTHWGIASNMVPLVASHGAVAWGTINSVRQSIAEAKLYGRG